MQPLDPDVSFPALEQEVLTYWRTGRIAARSLERGEKPFVFYECPPTNNGQPGLHHAISQCFKDTIMRFRSMQGYRVLGRREGWDAHGIAVEVAVEKALGLEGKAAVERYGIAAFNQQCRALVGRSIGDWRRFNDRFACWLGDDAFLTCDTPYIESVWWAVRQLWDRGLIGRDRRVILSCPLCGTGMSDHEAQMAFREEVDHPSAWVRLRIVGHDGDPRLEHQLRGASLLTWTTAPWQLPAVAALAVHPSVTYALVDDPAGDAAGRLVLAADRVPGTLGEAARIVATFAGRDLAGLTYERAFDDLPEGAVDPHRARRVIADEAVRLAGGTGIVPIAPAYGDLELARRHGLPVLWSVGPDGRMLHDFGIAGLRRAFFKDADPAIMHHLARRGLLLRGARVSQAGPFCWRHGAPALPIARQAWFLRTSAFVEQMRAANRRVHWQPAHLRDGRFGARLAGDSDWAISTERYWGIPLPIWTSADGDHSVCIGSLAELERRVGRPLRDLDLHRPYVDDLTWESPDGHGLMRRVPEVLDCWFDSGALCVAQWHYPFEPRARSALAYPADFICGGLDQTHGWFYTLFALGLLLLDEPPYRNVLCVGLVVDGRGEKMSKSRGNAVDPWQIFSDSGADALRWSFCVTPPVGDLRPFRLTAVDAAVQRFLRPLWQLGARLVTYAQQSGWQPIPAADAPVAPPAHTTPADRQALADLGHLIGVVTGGLERYDLHTPAVAIERFVQALTSSFWPDLERRRTDADRHAACHTLHTCLVTVSKLTAPFAPFTSEALYRCLVARDDTDAPESVHLARWPVVNSE